MSFNALEIIDKLRQLEDLVHFKEDQLKEIYEKIEVLQKERENQKAALGSLEAKLADETALRHVTLADVMVQEAAQLPSWEATVLHLEARLGQMDKRYDEKRKKLRALQSQRHETFLTNLSQGMTRESLMSAANGELKAVQLEIERLTKAEDELRKGDERRKHLRNAVSKSELFCACLNDQIKEAEEAVSLATTEATEKTFLKEKLRTDPGYVDPELTILEKRLEEVEAKELCEKISGFKRSLSVTQQVLNNSEEVTKPKFKFSKFSH